MESTHPAVPDVTTAAEAPAQTATVPPRSSLRWTRYVTVAAPATETVHDSATPPVTSDATTTPALDGANTAAASEAVRGGTASWNAAAEPATTGVAAATSVATTTPARVRARRSAGISPR